MRTLPEDDDDRAALARLKVEPWMVEYLKLNPEYVHWGPGDDLMSTKGESQQAAQEFASWLAFGPWPLDKWNECVHFYFELERPSERCEVCDASGYNSLTKFIADAFYYNVAGSTENRWCDKITQDEVDALVEAGRLCKWTEGGLQTVPRTAAEVNAANTANDKYNEHHHELKHDAINRMILIETRAKRFGVWGLCSFCEGHGTVFAVPHGHLNVVLWILHPRTGCARGVRVRNLSASDAEAAKRWLAQAATRNRQRFEKVVNSIEAAVASERDLPKIDDSSPFLTPKQAAVLSRCFRNDSGELQRRVISGEEDDHLAEMIDAYDAYFAMCRAKLGHDRVPIATWDTYTIIKSRKAFVAGHP